MLTQLCFDDTIYWANCNALGRIVVTFTFDTGRLIDDIGDTVTFSDGFGWAVGYACTAGDAIFSDLHGHVATPIGKFGTALN
jgi:hypothetical protein